MRAKISFAPVRKAVGLVVLVWSGSLFGQKILDDSTQNVYSAKTTFVAKEIDIKNNGLDAFQVIDTSINRIEQFDVYDRLNRGHQSLGTLGSPLWDLSYSRWHNDHPGRTLGMHVYDHYFPNTRDFKIYDTKSPFIDLGVALAGRNRTTIDLSFSRNVNDHWNVGFDVHRITSDKQNGLASEGDRRIETSIFDIYSFYEHPSERYDALVSVTNMVFDNAETGGVDFTTTDSLEIELFQYEDATIRLSNATSQERRFRVHLLHQFKLGSGFQIYHQLDVDQHSYKYIDENEGAAYDRFYPIRLSLGDSSISGIDEKTEFQAFSNEAGLKGTIGGVFYRFFARRRELQYRSTFLFNDRNSENYAGTYLRLRTDRFQLEGQGMISLDGAYNLEGAVKNKNFELAYRSSNRLPSLLEADYLGAHHEWTNAFDPVFLNEFEGSFRVRTGPVEWVPRAKINALTNYIYFDEFNPMDLSMPPVDTSRSIAPFQSADPILVTELGGQANVGFLNNGGEGFHLDNEVIVANASGGGSDVIRLPTFRYTGRVYWSGSWFKNTVPTQIGFNIYARSAYFGHQYDPVVQQFYVQDEFELGSYWSADFFLTMDILNLSLFFKVTHVNQQNNSGFMASPFYPGQPRTLDLGVRWLFFD